MDLSSFCSELSSNGVVVIPIIPEHNINYYHDRFYQELSRFPEYKFDSCSSYNLGQGLDSKAKIYVYGSFGALGNPASFHNSLVREIRTKIMVCARSLFRSVTEEYKLEQLIDRMSIRTIGSQVPKETWHRDVAGGRQQDDIIFGGWLNLDLHNEQYFSCIPGSQINGGNGNDFIGDGFVRQDSLLESQKKIYKVPPGHWIIFNQNIIHEVISRKMKYESIRLYIGFRLTKSDSNLYDYTEALVNQGVPIGPSGNFPTMYFKNHLRFHKDKVLEWSEKSFKDQCLETEIKSGRHIVREVMKSLREYNLELYPEYTPEELDLFKPSRIV